MSRGGFAYLPGTRSQPTSLFQFVPPLRPLSLLSQVVGCRGPVQINPRLLMSTEGSVTGVNLMASSDVSGGAVVVVVDVGCCLTHRSVDDPHCAGTDRESSVRSEAKQL